MRRCFQHLAVGTQFDGATVTATEKRQTADEHPVADGNGVAMVWSQVVDAVCSGGNAWMQLRLGGSFVVCPKTFFLSERRFAQAPRASCFFDDRVTAAPTYFFHTNQHI